MLEVPDLVRQQMSLDSAITCGSRSCRRDACGNDGCSAPKVASQVVDVERVRPALGLEGVTRNIVVKSNALVCSGAKFKGTATEDTGTNGLTVSGTNWIDPSSMCKITDYISSIVRLP